MQQGDEPALARRILDAYEDMPRGERRLAEQLLESPGDLATHSATELARRAKVSKATAARLFKRLGYSSFRGARQATRADGALVAAAPRFGARLKDLSEHAVDLSMHLTSEVQNLIRTVETMRAEDLNLAIGALARADKLWVVGFGDNYPLAHFARALLIRIRPDIRMIPIGGFSVPEEFASITAADGMLAFGLNRRTMSLRNIMRSATRVGAQVVYVTDQAGRAGPEVASVTLRCRTRGAALFNSVIAPVSFVTYLGSALATRLGEGAIERLHLIDSIHDEWGGLIDSDL